jgi:precorrin-6B methylase 2
VEIHPRDPKYTQGRYYIGVLAYGEALCRYQLQASLSQVQKITIIDQNATGEGFPWEYFQYQAKWPGSSRLQVKVATVGANSSIYVSTSAYYPSEAKCQWYVSSPWLWEAETEEMLLDPYRAMMPRQYVKPKAKWARRQKTEAVLGYTETPGTLILCIDTDSSEDSPKCYNIAISNPAKYQFHLSVTEVMLTQLLSEQHQSLISLFNSFTADLQGAVLSYSERERLALPHYGQFTYGEVEFASMIPMLDMCEIEPGEVFWDLGCGTGKCLIAAALLHPELSAVKGVELLEGLYNACCEAISRYEAERKTSISVIQGDILVVDWSEADVVYISSLCFPDSLLTQTAVCMEKLKPGARILTLKAFLSGSAFLLLRTVKVKMTWGPASIYLYQRL